MVGVEAWRVIIVCWWFGWEPSKYLGGWESSAAASVWRCRWESIPSFIRPLGSALPCQQTLCVGHWQPRAQGCGSRWERQAPKALVMETWAGLLGMEPWSQMNLDWITISALLFLGRMTQYPLTYGNAHECHKSCAVLEKPGFLRCHKTS